MQDPRQGVTAHDSDEGLATRELVDALRAVQDLVLASAPPPALSRRLADSLCEVAQALAEHPTPYGTAVAGTLAGVPGRGHPLLPPLVVDHLDADRFRGRVVLSGLYLGGGGAHGGCLPLLFDEVFGHIANGGSRPFSRTAALHVDYRSVTPLDRELRVTARFERQEGRKRYLTAELHDGDVLVAEANALFVVLRSSSPADAGAPT